MKSWIVGVGAVAALASGCLDTTASSSPLLGAVARGQVTKAGGTPVAGASVEVALLTAVVTGQQQVLLDDVIVFTDNTGNFLVPFFVQGVGEQVGAVSIRVTPTVATQLVLKDTLNIPTSITLTLPPRDTTVVNIELQPIQP